MADWQMRDVLDMDVPDWVTSENERIKKEGADRAAEKGYKLPVKIEPGVTEVEIDLKVIPRQVEDKKYGGTKYFFDLISPADKALRVPPTLYALILKKIAVNKHGKIKITRIGTGAKDTKYDVI